MSEAGRKMLAATEALIAELIALRAENERLRVEVAEKQATFEIRWKSDRRATARWQEATGEELTWPDHADLCVWLLEENAKLRREWEVVIWESRETRGYVIRLKFKCQWLNSKGQWGVVPLLFESSEQAEAFAISKLDAAMKGERT